jgi:hypothetical protein
LDGSGFGDFKVKLNDQDIIAQGRLQSLKVRQTSFYSAFADITAQVKGTGSGVYNLN